MPLKHLLPALLALLWATPAQALGCVRSSCSAMDDAGSPYLAAGSWRITQGYRFFDSHRMFVGDAEQPQRALDGSQVENWVHLFDEQLSYGLADRLSLDLTAPVQVATRTSPIRDVNNAVTGKDTSWANGPGDLQLALRGWLWDPRAMPPANLQLGAGLKLPTGADAVQTTRHVYNAATGTVAPAVQAVDESVQPGDGGWGGLFTLSAFWQPSERGAVYLDGFYLLNPGNMNGVPSYRTTALEAEVSLADQYQLRAGAIAPLPLLPGLAASLGCRLDGVPVTDLLGASDGFRRPGFAFSFDPGLTYTHGNAAFSLNVAVPVVRDRLASLADQANHTVGDASFADYLLDARFSYLFGK